ncbi:MAG TPA: hypothetical protein VEY89_07225, partial [Candidatus Dormibacteraeota bacterium]|nr:hypothetical protein [Candidatus Dormibacteraeota bacterium]
QTTGLGNGHSNVGKQEGAVSSRFIFPGQVPFAVYFEYAANDTSRGHSYLFGKPALSAGIHFPHIGPFDVTYEISDWERSWYVHSASAVQTGYLDGITNDGATIGHWFGDQRLFGDAPGGQSNMLRIAWEPPFGGRFETQLRTLSNQAYAAFPYRHEVTTSLSYSRPWHEYAIGVQIDADRDVFGERYTRLAGFMRYGDALRSSYAQSHDAAFAGRRAEGSELFVDVGANMTRVLVDVTSITPRYQTGQAIGAHFGLGARRQVSPHQDLGVRIEVDDVRRHALLAVRALDYRYRFDGPLAVGAFMGAARYALGTPAYGWWLGAGVQWRNILPGWDLNLDYRAGVELARERSLPTDLQGGYRSEAFYSPTGTSLYISRKF